MGFFIVTSLYDHANEEEVRPKPSLCCIDSKLHGADYFEDRPSRDCTKSDRIGPVPSVCMLQD